MECVWEMKSCAGHQPIKRVPRPHHLDGMETMLRHGAGVVGETRASKHQSSHVIDGPIGALSELELVTDSDKPRRRRQQLHQLQHHYR